MDSDAASVIALTPGGQEWHAYLHEVKAREYGAPPLPESIDESVAKAIAWSAEAGLSASAAGLAEVLEASNTFVEDTLDELLGALGVTTRG